MKLYNKTKIRRKSEKMKNINNKKRLSKIGDEEENGSRK